MYIITSYHVHHYIITCTSLHDTYIVTSRHVHIACIMLTHVLPLTLDVNVEGPPKPEELSSRAGFVTGDGREGGKEGGW